MTTTCTCDPLHLELGGYDAGCPTHNIHDTEPAWAAGAWMQTFTGKQFWPLRPDPEHVDILDIAHALSLICRYGGHARRFYSVAEHSVLLSYAVPSEHALWALMHDAAEAYVGDMVRPLKHQMPAYRAVEDRVLAAIAVRFDLPHREGLIPAVVKDADNRILLDERAAILTPTDHSWGVDDLEPLGVKVRGWEPVMAELAFRDRFEELTQ